VVAVAATVGVPNSQAGVTRSASARLRGSLTQLRGTRGCVGNGRRADCAPTRGFGTPVAVQLSPDGRTLYAMSSHFLAHEISGIAVLTRDPVTGELRQRPGPDGCLRRLAGLQGCGALGVGGELNPAGRDALAISPDGRFAYLAGQYVQIFRRDNVVGALLPLPAPSGCLRRRSRGCSSTATGIESPTVLALSPDGRFVYGVSHEGNFRTTVSVYARDVRAGTLRRVGGRHGCITDRNVPRRPATRCATVPLLGDAIAVSHDGRSVYVGGESWLITLRRDRRSGELFPVRSRRACLQSPWFSEHRVPGCRYVHGLGDVADIEVARNGRRVYVSGGNQIAVLQRDPSTGLLSATAGLAGCVTARPTRHCSIARGLRGVFTLEISLSPDDRNLYAAGQGLSVFGIDPASGELSQLPGGGGCLRQAAPRCRRVRHLFRGNHDLQVSPDGRHLYVASARGHAVLVLRRW
jgi:DNA-binding beta-propeller fold protein YncE